MPSDTPLSRRHSVTASLSFNFMSPSKQNTVKTPHIGPKMKYPHLLVHTAPQNIKTPVPRSFFANSIRQLLYHKDTTQHIPYHQANTPTNQRHQHHPHPSARILIPVIIHQKPNHVHPPHHQICMRPPHERRMGLLPPRQSQLQIRAFERGCGSHPALRRR